MCSEINNELPRMAFGFANGYLASATRGRRVEKLDVQFEAARGSSTNRPR